MDSRQHWEQSGLACSFEEYLEDALKERTLANQNLHKHIAELKAQVAALTEAARQYMDLKDYAPWEEYNTKRTALAALIQESE